MLAIPPKRIRPRAGHVPRTNTRSTRCSPLPTARPGPADATTRLLLLAIQTGLRASELTGLNCGDLHLGSRARTSAAAAKAASNGSRRSPQVTVAVLRVWLAERAGQSRRPAVPDQPRPTAQPRRPRTPAHQARHARQPRPARRCTRRTITPHTLRHTAAMQLLHAGVDTTVIALWLGHERVDTTQIYLHADLALKERALARTKPPDAKPGRYRPPDTLLAFLEAL